MEDRRMKGGFGIRVALAMIGGLFLAMAWASVVKALGLDGLDLMAGLVGLAFLCSLLSRPDQP